MHEHVHVHAHRSRLSSAYLVTMADKDMRLRLVVRREGLPEVRLLWNVMLENDPTVAKLLEKVNEVIPLEIGQTGLEDYAVELRDDDGTSFECLHYQPVRSVLKTDDRLYIRTLDKDDNRRRRLSGRYQISSEGKRLIDGLPWGRPLLKPPTSRPPIRVPPQKRRRLAYDQDETGWQNQPEDGAEDAPMLLLTSGESSRDGADSSSIGIGDGFEDADVEDNNYGEEAEPANFDADSESDEYAEEDLEMQDDEDIAQELRDLEEEEEENAALLGENGRRLGSGGDFEPHVRELEVENEQDDTKPSGGGAEPSAPLFDAPAPNLNDLDKSSALQAAFPKTPAVVCEKVLSNSAGDLKTSYRRLAEGFPPSLSESELLAWPNLSSSVSTKSKALRSRPPANDTAPAKPADDDPHIEGPNEEESDGEYQEEVPDLVRQFDYRGLPPGSITSGKGLAQMAAISGSFTSSKIGGKSEAASMTVKGSKASLSKEADKADTTSSSGTSSSSEDETSESDDDGSSIGGESLDDSTSDDDNDSESNDFSQSRRHVAGDSDSSSDDSSEDSDSGPEESSTRPQKLGSSRPSVQSKGSTKQDDLNENDHSEGPSDSDTTSSSEDSSESSSEDESSEAASSSESESDDIEVKSSSSRKILSKSQAVQGSSAEQAPQARSLAMPLKAVSQPQPVPPGAGKQNTKSRNARRRAAKHAKKLAQQGGHADDTSAMSARDQLSASTVTSEKALFEAKRQALLDAIANGGVEVGPSSQLEQPCDTSNTSTGTKRKHDQLYEPRNPNAPEETPNETSLDQDAQSSVSTGKRRRIDLGAGRRLLFGALGLRNPKTKEDEDALRAKLMSGVRPIANARLKQDDENTKQTEGDGERPTNDPDAWREKIKYRAVECCYEGVELSEPPFPFVQRWDPQQQGPSFQKKHKRGGQGKKAQRNQAHYYQDTYAGTKRKYDESVSWEERYSGYNDTFNGIDDSMHDTDIQLNYDDDGDDGDDGAVNEPTNETSQFTDLDDLPSLPSDLSTLPALRPGEAQVGMVITWQKWSCSSATNWQPQLSDVTGVVVRIDDDATGLEVCLAKRDRYLDGNPKRYDEHTGQRIYDRFEAPDLGEEDGDEEDDEGYRTIGFAEMQQPRVLQQPLPPDEPEDAQTNNCGRDESRLSSPEREVQEQSALPTGTDLLGKGSPIVTEEPMKESTEDFNRGVMADAAGSSGHHQPGQGRQATELSMSDLSGVSSPSRQLHQDTSQATGALSQGPFAQERFAPRDDWEGEPNNLDSMVTNSQDVRVNQSSDPVFSNGDEVISGTPRAVKPTKTVPSSASSARSGRQMDYSGLDMNVGDPESLKTTDDDVFDGVSVILGTEKQEDRESDEDMPTPTTTPARQTDMNVQQGETRGRPGAASSPAPSTPGSLCSLNTIWCTARTSLKTQSPSKSQSQSESVNRPGKSQARKDTEYEEAMRKLEDFSDDRDSSSRVTDTFKTKAQRSLDGILEDDENVFIKESSTSPHPSTGVRISPPPIRKRRLPKPRSSQFSIPPGSQVVELSSDSEPVYSESYADDEVDENYSPKSSSIPRGGGWVDKKIDSTRHITRRSTGPIGSQPPKKRRFLSASQSQSLSPSTSTSTSSWSQAVGKSRRKTSARF
ncbi:hypothetical protein F5B20DRAFT_536478 [Whalleya microplaca]|nr:hypothetical protein F5B20DRAFT_536478 [Whalleya microplaca]